MSAVLSFICNNLNTAINSNNVMEQKRWIRYACQVGQHINRKGINTAVGAYKLEIHADLISQRYHLEAFHAKDECINPSLNTHTGTGIDEYGSCTWANEGKSILLDKALQELPDILGGTIMNVPYDSTIINALLVLAGS